MITIAIDNALSSLPDMPQFVIQLPLLLYVVEYCGNYLKSLLRIYRPRFGQHITESYVDLIMIISFILAFFVSGGLKQSIMHIYNIPYIFNFKQYKT
jgi:hypothetical protein